MFRSRISHFVRRSFTRSSFAGWWPATSHGFATMDPRRRRSHCSRNILSLLELGSSGQDRLRGKLWPLSFGIRMASCLWTFWARSAGRLWPVHPTPAETEEWHPGQATGHWHQGHHHSSRQLAYSFILWPRVRNLRNWYGRWFLTHRTALIWRHLTSTCSDYWKTSSVASISQITANWIRQWVYRPKM